MRWLDDEKWMLENMPVWYVIRAVLIAICVAAIVGLVVGL